MNEFCLSEVLKEKLHQAEQELGDRDKLIEIEPHMLDAWEYRDDIEVDLSSVEALANSIREKGQSQPIVVTKANGMFKQKSNTHVQYVVIAGYRRYLACKKLNRHVQAVVRNYTFEQAIACLLSENEKHDVSDFSVGLVCHNLLNSTKISRNELCKNLHITEADLEKLLIFSDIPICFWSKTADVHNISRYAAVVVKKYWNMGQRYRHALDKVAPMIGKTKSTKNWEKAILNQVHGVKEKQLPTPFELSKNGRKLMRVKNGQVKFYASIANNKGFQKLQDQIAALTLSFYRDNIENKE